MDEMAGEGFFAVAIQMSLPKDWAPPVANKRIVRMSREAEV